MAIARGTVPKPQGYFMKMQEARGVSSTTCFTVRGAGCLLATPHTMFLWLFRRAQESSSHDLCLPNCGEPDATLDREQPVQFAFNGGVLDGCSRPVSFPLRLKNQPSPHRWREGSQDSRRGSPPGPRPRLRDAGSGARVLVLPLALDKRGRPGFAGGVDAMPFRCCRLAFVSRAPGAGPIPAASGRPAGPGAARADRSGARRTGGRDTAGETAGS